MNFRLTLHHGRDDCEGQEGTPGSGVEQVGTETRVPVHCPGGGQEEWHRHGGGRCEEWRGWGKVLDGIQGAFGAGGGEITVAVASSGRYRWRESSGGMGEERIGRY